MTCKSPGFWAIFALQVIVAATCLQAADEPLHVSIDQLVKTGHVGKVAQPASDGEFLRRLYLDLLGRIPSSTEARDFLDDKSADKRLKWIEKTLEQPEYARHMANTFDVMLMERRGEKHVKNNEWRSYLEQSFTANKPWSTLAREILSADGIDPKLRPAARFYMDRDAEVNRLTRDVGRMFFGIDLECAQCHDHPLIDDYYQSHYYGIYAFLNRGYLYEDKKAKKHYYAEKAEGYVTFKSVFTEESGRTGPRVPGGVTIEEPSFNKGQEYVEKPRGSFPEPKFSRRQQLAEQATNGTNRLFNQNIANRLWAHMMGRGLVEPVDLQHTDNPPTDPKLLELLAQNLVVNQFDMKSFLKELALTETYQRAVDVPQDLAEQAAQIAEQIPAIEAEHKRLLEIAEKSADALEKVREEVAAETTKVEPTITAFLKVEQALAEAKKKLDAANTAASKVQTSLGAQQELAKALAEAAEAAAVAAKLLPDDKELAAAVASFKKRGEPLPAEIEKLTKDLATKQAATKVETDKLAAAQETTNKSRAELKTALEPLRALEQRSEVANRQRETEKLTAANVLQRLTTAKNLVQYNELRVAAVASQAEADKSAQALASAKEQQKKVNSQLQGEQKTLAEAATADAAAQKTLAESRGKLTTTEETVKALAAASAKAEVIKKKLPKEKELVAAADTLKGRHDALAKQVDPLKKQVAEHQTAAEATAARLTAAQKTVAATNEKLATAQTEVDKLQPIRDRADSDRQQRDTALDKLVGEWSNQFAISTIAPLSPEQLARSMMQATGQVERHRVAVTAELEKKTPLSDEDKKNAEKVAKRATEIENGTRAKVAANTAEFVKKFGGAPGQPQNQFFATVDQALFLANGGMVQSWLAPGGENLVSRLVKSEDLQVIAEELYLSILTRRPSAEEVADIQQFLTERKDEKTLGVQEIAWALLTSAEFRFSY